MRFDPDATWFTSDTHYHHKNIVRCLSDWEDKDDCRDFPSIEAMDDALVEAIAIVPKDCVLFHLGDVAFGGIERSFEFMRRLNRPFLNNYLIVGNHDQRELQDLCGSFGFRSIERFDEIKVGDQRITLCHYAMRVWNKSHRGAWQLYGHSHGTLQDDPKALSIDVGLDAHDFKPLSFRQIEEIMRQKIYEPVDHHGRNRE